MKSTPSARNSFWPHGLKLLVLCIIFLAALSSNGVAQDRFGLDSAHVKATNNYGKGDTALWGSRNLRVVLKNILYRGGGNNFHLKESQPKSYIKNPLPLKGISRLHESGFGSAWYLYSTNFNELYPAERLDSLRSSGFSYECHPSLSEEVVRDFMHQIHDLMQTPNPRPMYIHCWNGWHQSGMLSAFTFMQFCGLSNQQALKYWEQNTDGNHSGYSAVKSRILSYVPDSDIQISDSLKAQICPCFTNDVMSSKGKTIAEVQKEGEGGSKQNMEVKAPPVSKERKAVYRVKKGDTLSAIAQRNNTTVKKLCALNGIKANKVLQIGEHIRLR
jgi:LysM repeat protein